MAEYLLSVYQPVGPAPAPDFLEPIMRDVEALNREMKAAGAWVFGAGLHPTETATVVRQQGTGVLITDGPFAEAKEHIGGFTVIEAPDLDEALGWAEKLARATTLPIEVRPVQH
ncbi:YciI family protein [Pseudarthrobacter sp. PvP090]|uniref:YciI family protein n=1 Tax=Pseudarthrobacter sp. PvP090 TaxID=3156393 RepID=UPI0033941839